MKAFERINQKVAESESIVDLVRQLSGSELNTFLLALFDERSGQISPGELMDQYRRNRFVQLARLDPIAYKTFELGYLKAVAKRGFEPIILSPLAPVGTSSVVAKVSQRNIVSASRGTEVVSDATNVLALAIADFHKQPQHRGRIIQYATTHRHVRGQAFENPAFTAHFGILCLVTGGFDSGSFEFELNQLGGHLKMHYELLAARFGEERLSVQLRLADSEHPFHAFLDQWLETADLPFSIAILPQSGTNAYYQLFQFKIYLSLGEHTIDLADGGMVNWTQQLLSNRKHRMMISATGLELAYKFGLEMDEFRKKP